ncbi:MAG: hypothetical protein R3D00_20175 [Bacteroidia bacterium]
MKILQAIKSAIIPACLVFLSAGIYLSITDPKSIINSGILGFSIIALCLALRSMEIKTMVNSQQKMK